jgi:hypothetical protein
MPVIEIIDPDTHRVCFCLTPRESAILCGNHRNNVVEA